MLTQPDVPVQAQYVLFEDRTQDFTVVPYEAGKHLLFANRFLVWNVAVEGGVPSLLLIVGDGQPSLSLHVQLLEAVKRLVLLREVHDPVGAGVIKHRRIKYWDSEGLDVTTPHELRPTIQRALGIT